MSLFAARAGGLTAERAKVLEARTGIRDALLGCVGSVVQLPAFGNIARGSLKQSFRDSGPSELWGRKSSHFCSAESSFTSDCISVSSFVHGEAAESNSMLLAALLKQSQALHR